MEFEKESTVFSNKVNVDSPMVKENQIKDVTVGTPFNDSEKPKSGRWCRIWQMRRKILATAVFAYAILVLPLGAVLYARSVDLPKVITNGLLCLGVLCSLWLVVYELKSIFKQQKHQKRFWIITSVHIILALLILTAPILSLLLNLTPAYPWNLDCLSTLVLSIGFLIEWILCIYESIVYFIRSTMTLKAFLFSFSFFISVFILFGCFVILIDFLLEPYMEVGSMGENTYGYYIKFENGYVLSDETIFWSFAAITLILSTFWMNVFKNEAEGEINWLDYE